MGNGRRVDLNERFERDGFVVVKGVIEPHCCAEMIQRIWALMPQRFHPDQPENWTGRIEDCCNNLPPYQRNGLLRYKDKHGFRHDPAFNRNIYSSPELTAVFETVTGRSLERLHIRGLHPILPMPRRVSINELTGNRLDRQLDGPEKNWPKVPCPPPLPVLGHLDAHPMDVGMMIYLDKVDPNAGGLAVWPGSHRLLKPCFESLADFLPTRGYRRALRFLQRFQPIDLAAGQGDVILFHNRLLHSNSVNWSQNVRQAVLVDAFGAHWRELDAAWQLDEAAQAERLGLAETDRIARHPLARSVTAGLGLSLARAFWSRHRRLRGWVSEIGKDPVGKARRRLSAKIRSRCEGDCWVVVSQDELHRTSHKLDAFGDDARGRYSLSVNGTRTTKSLSGSIVERIELRDGRNALVLKGAFGTRHYARVIRTRNPFEESEMLYTGTIEPSPQPEHHRIIIDVEAPNGADRPEVTAAA